MEGFGSGMDKPKTTLYSPYRSWKGQMNKMKAGFSMAKAKKVSNPLSPVKVGKLSGTVAKIVG
jgi:hypothetical protein